MSRLAMRVTRCIEIMAFDIQLHKNSDCFRPFPKTSKGLQRHGGGDPITGILRPRWLA
jgi:hypothetical protein